MKFAWAVIFLASCLAGQISSTELEDRAAQLIEGFRGIMAAGFPSARIPVLEPATVNKIPISIKVSPIDAKVIASNIAVSGASTFKVNKISQISGTNKLAVEIEVPEINVSGEYDVNGRVKIGFIKIKLNEDGPLKLTIKNVKAQATADVLINNDGSLNLNGLTVDSWSYGKIKIQLDKILGGGAMGKTVNALINKLVPTFVNGMRNKINQIAEKHGKQVINQYLDAVFGKTLVRTRLLSLPVSYVEEIALHDVEVTPEVQDILDQLAAFAVISNDEETDLEKKVAEIIEDFRNIMAPGFPAGSIPSLEPYVIKQLPITVKLTPFDAKAVASNVQVAGASSFEITKLSQIDGTNKLSVELSVPDVNVAGEYDLNGKVKIGFIKIGLKGNGPLTLSIRGIKAAATADVLVNNDGSLNLNSLAVDSWSYDSIKIHLDNLFNGGALGDTVNALVNKLVPTFVKLNRAKINQLAETMGKKIINQYLDGVSGKQSHRRMLLQAAPLSAISLQDFIINDEVQDILDQLGLLAIGAHVAIAA